MVERKYIIKSVYDMNNPIEVRGTRMSSVMDSTRFIYNYDEIVAVVPIKGFLILIE